MATWSDKQLGGHKRAQSYISSAGATLGVAALGAAAMKTPAARKGGLKLVHRAEKRGLGLKGSMKARNAIDRAGRATGGLTAGSAGVGGIGGYNFAAIQSQEAKKAKVRKVDENPFAVSKAKTKSVVKDPAVRRNIRRKDTAAGVLGAAGGAAAAVGATRLLRGRAITAGAKFGGARSPQAVKNVNRFAAKSGALTAGGVGGMIASDKLTQSADRQWAGAAKARVRKSEEISKLKLPKIKNPHVSRARPSGVGPVKETTPKVKRSLKFNPLSDGALIGGSALGGAVVGAAGNPAGRKERVRVMRQQGTLSKSYELEGVSKVVRVSAFGRAATATAARPPRSAGTKLSMGGSRGNAIPTLKRPPSTKFAMKPSGPATRGTQSRLANRGRNQIGGGAPTGGGLSLRPTAGGLGGGPGAGGQQRSNLGRNLAIGAGVGALAGGTGAGLNQRRRKSGVVKAFNPERSRHKRTEAYQAGGYAAAGALGATGARKVGVQASNLKSALKTGSVSSKQLGAIGRTGGKGLALVAAGAGAAAGAKKVGDYRKGKGRSYKALPLS